MFFHASTRFQKSLRSAKQTWFQKVHSGTAHHPKSAQRPLSGKQFTAFPASVMCDSHYAKGTGQGHRWENIQEETRRAACFWTATAWCSLPEYMTKNVALCSEMLPSLVFRFPRKSSVSNLHQNLFLSLAQLILTLLVFHLDFAMVCLTNSTQTSTARCDDAFSGLIWKPEEDPRGLLPRLRSRNKIHFPQVVSHSAFASRR